MKKVVFDIYSPGGTVVKTFDNRKSAKAFIDDKNKNTPSWHYEDWWRIGSRVVTY